MKRVFIVNPIAGNGKAIKIGKALEEICDSENLNYELVYTTGINSARELARKYCSEYRENIVYAVGGDGTLNEVVNGIVNSDTILGVIPAGTGNDFYKMIKTNSGDIVKIDIGKVNERYFVNIASLGIDAKIAARANALKSKIVASNLSYYLSILLEIINLESIELKIDEGSKNKNVTMMAVCNGAYYGGGFNIAPNASIHDGMFDIYEVAEMNRLQALKLFRLLIKKEHETSDLINHWKTDYLKVESSIPLICNIDGEIIVDNKFIFDNIENGIHLMCNDHPKIMSLHKKISK